MASRFAALEDYEDESQLEDEWQEVTRNKKEKKQAKSAAAVTSSSSAGPSSLAPQTSAAPAPQARTPSSTVTYSHASTSNGSVSASHITQQPVQAEPTSKVPTHGKDGRPLAADYYRAFQKAFVHERTGDLVFRFHKTDIVRIRPNGDIMLYSGGYHTLTTLLSMNDCLQHIGVKVKNQGDLSAGNWIVQDAHGSHRYEDNGVIPAKTAADKGRVQLALSGLQEEGKTKVESQPTRSPTTHHAARPQLNQQPHASAARGAAPPSGSASSSGAAPVAWGAAGQQQQRQQQQRTGGSSDGFGASGSQPAQQRAVPGAVYTGPPALSYAQRAATAGSNYQAIYARMVAARQGPAQAVPGYGPGMPAVGVSTISSTAAVAASAPAAPSDGFAPGGMDFSARSANLAPEHFSQFLGQSGAEDAHDDDEEHLCSVCFENERDTVLLPCSHTVLCSVCAMSIFTKPDESQRTCPVCRCTLMDVLHVAS